VKEPSIRHHGRVSGTVGPKGPKSVGFVVHGGRPEACSQASRAAGRFATHGVQVVGLEGEAWNGGAVEMRRPADFGEGLDVVVVFGGDGTFLRAAYLARDQGVPLLGANYGRLGFLSEVEGYDIETVVDRLIAGSYDVEERMTLAVEILDCSGEIVGTSWALNEASVERTVPQRLIVLQIRVGERVFANLPADGIICATPTGSTAYAFSAGGPILSPLVDAILIVPLAPHALFDRTIVVDPKEAVTLTPVGGDNSCVVTTDGHSSLAVPTGGSVRIVRGDAPVRMARFGPFDFYGRVRQKFGLP
jgi:NAD+ kinase